MRQILKICTDQQMITRQSATELARQQRAPALLQYSFFEHGAVPLASFSLSNVEQRRVTQARKLSSS